MSHIGNRKGYATLLVDGDEVGIVDYNVDFFECNRGRSGTGHLTGEMETLYAGFGAAKTTLRVPGGEAEIVLTRVTAGEATFKTSGPWPGV